MSSAGPYLYMNFSKLCFFVDDDSIAGMRFVIRIPIPPTPTSTSNFLTIPTSREIILKNLDQKPTRFCCRQLGDRRIECPKQRRLFSSGRLLASKPQSQFSAMSSWNFCTLGGRVGDVVQSHRSLEDHMLCITKGMWMKGHRRPQA
jgi:hypothetical protein